MNTNHLNFEELVAHAENIEFLIVQGGGMARKSDIEMILMGEFDVTRFDAHTITNHVELQNKRNWRVERGTVVWLAQRDEPTRKQYNFEKYKHRLKWFH